MKAIHAMSLAAAVALVPAAVYAQQQQQGSDPGQQQQQDQPQQQQGQQGQDQQQGQQQQQQGQMQQKQQDSDYIRQAVHLDQKLSKTVEGGCKYDVTIIGNITPSQNASNDKVPQVSPNLNVTAQASCPNQATFKMTDNLQGSGPLTWRQLADTLEQRARVITLEQNHACTYSPKFNIVASKVEMSSFDRRCTAV